MKEGACTSLGLWHTCAYVTSHGQAHLALADAWCRSSTKLVDCAPWSASQSPCCFTTTPLVHAIVCTVAHINSRAALPCMQAVCHRGAGPFSLEFNLASTILLGSALNSLCAYIHSMRAECCRLCGAALVRYCAWACHMRPTSLCSVFVAIEPTLECRVVLQHRLVFLQSAAAMHVPLTSAELAACKPRLAV